MQLLLQLLQAHQLRVVVRQLLVFFFRRFLGPVVRKREHEGAFGRIDFWLVLPDEDC